MKILFKLFVIISLVGLLSCKKEYVCECNGGIYNPRYVYHETKKKAKEKCGSEPMWDIYDPGRKCEIK